MKNSIFILIFVAFFSCDKKENNVVVKQDKKSLLSVSNTYKIVEKINPNFSAEISSWQELKAVDGFLLRFKKATSNEVLSNALELKALVQALKDNQKPALFNNDSFNTRVNILYNETLRLSDMTFIPAIKAEEVNEQTQKIMSAFSAINSKVNSILLKNKFEDEIEIDVRFIGLDTTKIHNASKNAQNLKLLESTPKKI